MTEEQKVHRLIGAIKLTPVADCIGLPVMKTARSNAVYVPEMDVELAITDFLTFVNEGQYHIEFNIPREEALRSYKVGDPAPIPYWVEGACHVIGGDSEASDISIKHPAHDHHDVLLTLRGALNDARTGVFKREQQEWVARDIANQFTDVFFEEPVYSLYWVNRFAQAIEHAARLVNAPHLVYQKLRALGLEWIRKFATKTDLRRFNRVISCLVANRALSIKRAQGLYFAFLMHKLESRSYKKIEADLVRSNEFAALFPYGLYIFYRDNNWPEVNFAYEKPYHIFDPFYKALQKAEADNNFEHVEWMSYAYFFKSDAPREIADAVVPLLENSKDEYVNEKRWFLNEGYQADDRVHLLKLYKNMMHLDGVLRGNVRLSGDFSNRRFDVDHRFVVDLFGGGDWIPL
ncbi:hypothetical protein [Methylobacterium sp. Leaf118]|uniref:hypothetical protein n=1 Tax=Methylobacterium sp. Leaf118 TaxID=2876562 RepID=UPI001E49BA5C|nr:hypothetical protein [Methylobacterium sp. Leaf118]